MQIVSFDPRAASLGDLDAWVGVWQAAARVDQPGDPLLPARFWLATATEGLGGLPQQAWLARISDGARDGGTDGAVGVATLELPEQDNTHAGLAELVVHPDHRRNGVGRALVGHLAQVSRNAGRRLLIGACAQGSAGPAFAADTGAERGLVETRRVLDLPVPAAQLRALHEESAARATGYRVVRWRGPTPAERVPEVLTLLERMSDAPTDDLEYGQEVWDAGRLERLDRAVAEAGLRVYVVAAEDERTGRLVAYTVVWVHLEPATWAWQGDTVVLPEHRGHRLGMLVKADMLRWLAEAEPQLVRMDTENAESNPHMVDINVALGFRVYDRWEEWQLDLTR